MAKQPERYKNDPSVNYSKVIERVRFSGQHSALAPVPGWPTRYEKEGHWAQYAEATLSAHEFNIASNNFHSRLLRCCTLESNGERSTLLDPHAYGY